MGFLLKDPRLRQLQLKNRINGAKGLVFFSVGIAVVFLLFKLMPCSNCEDEADKFKFIETYTTPVRVKRDLDEKYANLEPKLENVNNLSENEFNEYSKNFYDFQYKKLFKALKTNTTNLMTQEDIDLVVYCNNELQNLYSSNYQKNGIYWCDTDAFMTDLFTVEQRKAGWVFVHIIGLAYMFLALATTCDEYFVPSLEMISEKCEMSNDVAGATLMAAGGSAPELFTAIIGVFVAKSDVGIGTIVGSAVFNILFVLGACALVVGFKKDKEGKPTILSLTWFPLARDCAFYILALVLLVWTFNYDKIEWWEALILFGIYVSYVTFMMNNKKIEDLVAPKKSETGWASALTALNEKQGHFHTNTLYTLTRNTVRRTADDEPSNNDSNMTAYYMQRFITLNRRRKNDEIGGAFSPEETEPQTVIDGSPYELPLPQKGDSLKKILVKLVYLPLSILLKFTVPDVRFKSIQKYTGIYILSFFLSILWISFFSYLMVWWATRIGETWNIDAALMGLTVLAAGTSVPDLITSVIVAKEGHGDMAVSSSIGSNIFDVTVGMPLPWLMWSFFNGLKANAVSSSGLKCSIGLLLLMLVTLVSSILATGWKMNRVMGFMMLLLYVGFVAISLMLEYGTLSCPF